MKTQSKSTIATNLKKVREQTGYSVETLANLLDVDIELILKWEEGTEEPTLSMGLLLSKLYGVSVDDIFYNVEIDEGIPKEKKDDFRHNAWLNCLSNRSRCW